MSSVQVNKASHLKENLVGASFAVVLASLALYFIGPLTYLYMRVFPSATFSKPTFIQILIWVLFENVPDYLLSFLLSVVLGLYFLRFRLMRGDLPIVVFIIVGLLLKGIVLFHTYDSAFTSPPEKYALFGEAVAKVFSACFAYLAWRICSPKVKETRGKMVGSS